ncbi:DNA-3-methyladenine glycosylase 2 [Serratia liquefaciens]|nr:DNA-3-methyladenine glycosylase 2 [Serratia liquefaciens]
MSLSPGLQPVAEICYARIGQLFDLACDHDRSLARWAIWRRRGRAAPAGGAGCLRAGGARGAGPAGERGDAARLTAKVAAGWGEPLAEAPGYVLFPTPEALSRADPQALKALGMPLRRAEALIHLRPGGAQRRAAPDGAGGYRRRLRQLQTLPGIGRWTANYFALRGWQAKDIFLPDDYLIKQRFPGMTPAAIARYARRWQPMRSYALLHIWYTDDWAPAAE